MAETIKDQFAEELENEERQSEMSNDQLKDAIESTLSNIRRQSMLLGAQSMCSVILEKIMTAESLPGKRSMNDYKRLIKDLKKFCETGLSRKINTDGEAEVINNNTKLMEDSDEGNTNQSNT
jgi:hypothetical protein